jgi:hypothetical protein
MRLHPNQRRIESHELFDQDTREILADAIRSGKNKIPEAFVITDDQGHAIETVPFAIVLPEPLKK